MCSEQLTILCEISGSHGDEYKVFCDVVSCSLIGVNRRFRGAYCLHQGDDDEITRRYIPQDSKLQLKIFFSDTDERITFDGEHQIWWGARLGAYEYQNTVELDIEHGTTDKCSRRSRHRARVWLTDAWVGCSNYYQHFDRNWVYTREINVQAGRT
jgi:hypothetical protein